MRSFGAQHFKISKNVISELISELEGCSSHPSVQVAITTGRSGVASLSTGLMDEEECLEVSVGSRVGLGVSGRAKSQLWSLIAQEVWRGDDGR